MTDEHEYYHMPDHGHNTENEIPDGVMYCALSVTCMFSYLCHYLLEKL